MMMMMMMIFAFGLLLLVLLFRPSCHDLFNELVVVVVAILLQPSAQHVQELSLDGRLAAVRVVDECKTFNDLLPERCLAAVGGLELGQERTEEGNVRPTLGDADEPELVPIALFAKNRFDDLMPAQARGPSLFLDAGDHEPKQYVVPGTSEECLRFDDFEEPLDEHIAAALEKCFKAQRCQSCVCTKS